MAVVVSAGFLKKVYSQRDVGLLNSLRLAGEGDRAAGVRLFLAGSWAGQALFNSLLA